MERTVVAGLRSAPSRHFGFGPVSPVGVGISYLVADDGVNLCISSWRANGPPAAQLARAITDAMGKLAQLAARPASRL